MQPVSVQAQTGVNIAAGVSTMELRPATAPARRRAQWWPIAGEGDNPWPSQCCRGSLNKHRV